MQGADTQTRCENRLPDVAALLCFARESKWSTMTGLTGEDRFHSTSLAKSNKNRERVERDGLAGKQEMSNYDY